MSPTSKNYSSFYIHLHIKEKKIVYSIYLHNSGRPRMDTINIVCRRVAIVGADVNLFDTKKRGKVISKLDGVKNKNLILSIQKVITELYKDYKYVRNEIKSNKNNQIN